MINANKPLNTDDIDKNEADLGKLNLFCTACKSGYRPVYSDRFTMQVIECVEISNCQTHLTTANGCDECDADHIWGYTSGKGIDHSYCIDWTGKDENCYAANNDVCMYCK